MVTISLRDIVKSRAGGVFDHLPAIVQRIFISSLEHLLCLTKVNSFLQRHRHTRGIDFVDELFEELEMSFLVSLRERNRIPSEGKLICVANHPLGGLDGLAILRVIKEVRPDVRVVANDVLLAIDPLSNEFLPMNVFSGGSLRSSMKAIDDALEGGGAVIIFPSGEVSRLTSGGVFDGKWNRGAVHFAKKHGASILPIFVHGHNSMLFYLISLVAKPLSTLLLPREMFRRRRNSITLKIGMPIPAKAFVSLDTEAATILLKKQTYGLKTGARGLFTTEQNIIHPSGLKDLIQQLSNGIDLGAPSPGKRLYLVTMSDAPVAVREIARLRELTFRKVGEGTGRRMDSDAFDSYYHHLVLWDEKELEIVGAYRLGLGRRILEEKGVEGFYTNSLFEFSPVLCGLLADSMEMGRSFIQPRYWNTYALEYIWAGIGAILRANPSLRYMFGPVSISNSYPAQCKDALVHFYRKWFNSPAELAMSRTPYHLTAQSDAELCDFFVGANFREDLNFLKMRLRTHGTSIPMLYRQYTELTDEGGVVFGDFGVDNDFGGCVDGFVLVDLRRLTAAKRDRYVDKYSKILTAPNLAGLDSVTNERHVVH